MNCISRDTFHYKATQQGNILFLIYHAPADFLIVPLLYNYICTTSALKTIIEAIGKHSRNLACRKVRKLCLEPYISIGNPLQTDLHTSSYIQPQTLHSHPPCLPDYEPHTKAFGI